MLGFTEWRKSSYSGGEGENCVEQRRHSGAGTVDVRDSKEGENGSILSFSPQAWTAFVQELCEDDRLTGGHSA